VRTTGSHRHAASGTSENVAMKLSGHKTRSVFDRYDIVSGDDREKLRVVSMWHLAASRQHRARRAN